MSSIIISGDEYCYFYNGQYYLSDTGLIFIQRYLQAFDEVNVVFRTRHISEFTALGKYHNPIANQRVKFIDTPFFQGPIQFVRKYLNIYSTLNKNIHDCELAILRLPSTTAFVVSQIISKRKIPVATEIVFDCKDAADSSENKIRRLIWTIMHRMQVNICKKAIGVSCVTEHYLQKHYYSLLPSAITSHYSSIELTPDCFLYPRQFPNKEHLTIIHVANQVIFNSRKGHNQLIEVLARLNKDTRRAQLVFVGEDYQNGVKQLQDYAKQFGVTNDIIFSGYVGKKRMRELLEEADIAVLPTKAEGLPRVVIEAMAMGLPCITTPVSGNPELISKDYLIDYNDIEGMADACRRLLDIPSEYEAQSNLNFENSQQYSTTVLQPRRTEFYNNLLQIISSKHNK